MRIEIAQPITARALVQSKSLPALVQDEILKMILAGDLDAGAKLNEVALATRLGVSRGPVREAFRALEEAGLVRGEKNRGVFVREISDDEASELYDVRAGLDETAGRLLVRRISDAEVDELRAMVRDMSRAASIETYFPLNIRFHDRIVELTGNRKLLAMYRRLINEMHLLRQRGLVFGGGLLVSNDEHAIIVEALARRDVRAVTRTMRDHVLAGRERLLVAMRAVRPRGGNVTADAAKD
jgi:phosphonate utilization transcriptional regulator